MAPQRSQPQKDYHTFIDYRPGTYGIHIVPVIDLWPLGLVPTLTDAVKSLTTNLHPHRRGQAADAEPECPSTAAS
jgi:hypothetical protein